MKYTYLPIILALAIAAGCAKQEAHAEGDGHDHGAEASAAAKSETSPRDESGHGDDGHAHEEEQKPAPKDEHAAGEEDHSAEPITLTEGQKAIAGIEVQKVAIRQIQPSITVPGTIASTTTGRAVVTPPVAGRVISLSVSLGQTVTRGQTLAVIESTELAEAWSRIAEASRSRDEANARVRESENQVQLATAKLTASRQTLARQREFAAAGAFNQAPLQQAQSEVNEAQSELLSAQKEEASHADQLRRLEILFRDGLVSKSDLDAARLDVQQDAIRVNRASSRVSAAKVTYDREKRIAERGLLNSREVQTAAADTRSASLELERARGALRSSRELVGSAQRAVANAQATYRTFAGGAQASGGRVNLVAPLTGVISRFDVTRGQAVDRTQALFEVENLGKVWAVAQVPERESANLRKGARVMVSTASVPGRFFSGMVQIVSSRIDPKTRTLAVQCLLENPGSLLKPEMFVSIQLMRGMSRNVLAVPSSAIVTDAGKSYLFVKDGEGFARHEVSLGLVSAGFTEVLSGIEENEAIAVKGAFILKSQQKKDELKGHEH